jgi:cytoskeleton protein RodZ
MQELPTGMASIGIGERLRSARQALGLSLEEIESVTHIRRGYLEALEREAFDVLPGPAYIRGFLRAYAACLGLPPEDVLDRYPAITPGEVPHRESPVEVRITPALRMSPVRRAVMGVGLLVGLGVVFVGVVLYIQVREFVLTAPERPATAPGAPPQSPTKPPLKAVPPAPVPPAATPGGVPPHPPAAAPPAGPRRPGAASGSPSAAPPPVAPPPAPAPQVKPPATTPSPTASPPPAKPGSPPAAAGAPGTPPASGPPAPPQKVPPGALPGVPQPSALNVAVAASGHTWVRTVADGATVFEGFLNAGDRQTWQAKRSLTVRVGNAGVVDIAVNGKSVGPLGGSGQVYEHTFASGAPSP